MEKVHLDFRDQVASNKRRSFFMIFAIFIVLIAVGFVISMTFSQEYFFLIMILAIIISLIYVWAGYYNSHKIAVSSVGAKEAKRSQYPLYHSLVEGLTIASGLPKPKLYVMKSSQINAFASGRNPENAVVCVTEGALEKLEKRELEGVLAHELSHVANYDIRYMTIVTILVGMIAIISEIFLRSLFFSGGRDNDKGKLIILVVGIVLAILAPIVVYLIQMSISRKREFSADATAVKFTRYPNGLIGALEKIKSDHNKEKKVSKAMAPMFFSNPLKNAGRTHPPLDERINVLRRM